MIITVDSCGSSVGKKSERLVIRNKEDTRWEQPLFDVDQVLIAKGASISSDVVQECMNRGIQIIFADRSGQPYGIISSPEMNGTIRTRREQLAAYQDPRGVAFVKASAVAKLRNQVNVIKYFLKSRRHDLELTAACSGHINVIQQASLSLLQISGQRIDDVREMLMTLEAQAARGYWAAVALLLPPELNFGRREHQQATSVVNMLLNYGYGILYAKAWSALILSGLDPYGGFMHVDRPGKPSLVYDFVEEFRQPVVDRVVLAALLRGYRPTVEEDFLDLPSRRDLAERIKQRLEDSDRHDKAKRQLRHIVEQARHLATSLRGSGDYRGYVAGR